MCGIAIALGCADAAAVVDKMIGSLRHRGEVSDPVFSPRADLAVATRRLPIVDAQHGVQPQTSSSGRVHVVMNGELYNHGELRGELVVLGNRFRTASDVEVVATALEAWGLSAFGRFEGMFALFAIDEASGEWLAARDPFGVKPLYVVEDLAAGSRFFCSEIKPLLDATETLPVLQLPPGHILTKEGCFRYRPRWRFLSEPHVPLDTVLRNAVRSRLPPDQGFGILFSGGLDSTLVLHYALEAEQKLSAYVLGDEGSPDLAFAADFAANVGLEPRIVALTRAEASIGADIERAISAVETFEPETVRSGHCSLRLAEAVRGDGLRVAISGDGADELFAGYVPLEEAYAVGDLEGDDVREQCITTLDVTALQRIDRCGMRHQVEIREPFLDSGVVAAATQFGRTELIRQGPAGWVGKQPLREVYTAAGLPPSIASRLKSPLNEGSGFDSGQLSSPWIEYAQGSISDSDLRDSIAQFHAFAVKTKEEALYIQILAKLIDINRVPHLRQRPMIRMPEAAITVRAAAFGRR